MRAIEHGCRQIIIGLGDSATVGAGCAAFFGALPQSGAEWVGRRIGLEEAVARADIVFTGEGRIAAQTAFGKIPEFVGRLAKKYGKHVVALGGAVEAGLDLAPAGISAYRNINPPGISLSVAFRDAEKNLALAAAEVMMKLIKKKPEFRIKLFLMFCVIKSLFFILTTDFCRLTT